MKNFLSIKRAASFRTRNISKHEIPEDDFDELVSGCFIFGTEEAQVMGLSQYIPENFEDYKDKLPCLYHDSRGYATFLVKELHLKVFQLMVQNYLQLKMHGESQMVL